MVSSRLERRERRDPGRDRHDPRELEPGEPLVNRRLEEAGLWPHPDGLEYHFLFGPEGSMRVSEIWDSREQMDAFGERLMPILADVGIEFSGEPEIFEVHNMVKR